MEDLIYLAGFFDGEGNIDCSHHKPTYANRYGQYALQVRVAQVNKWILDELSNSFGGKVVPCRRKHSKYKIMWHWLLSSKTAANLLEAMLPYLRLKRGEAEAAIEFQSLIGTGGKGKGRRLSESQLEARERAFQKFRAIRDKQHSEVGR